VETLLPKYLSIQNILLQEAGERPELAETGGTKMTEPFVETETDRTKSKWVARAYSDFVKETRRSRTTERGLFYYALQRKVSDYPICGGFVGEIRIMRPYHENDGLKLPKWLGKAKAQGYVPDDAIFDESQREQILLPEQSRNLRNLPCSVEVWLNKTSLHPLLAPVCRKHDASLVSVQGWPSKEALDALFGRAAERPTIVLCLNDLNANGAFFAADLATLITKAKPQGCGSDIKIKCIGLLPEQISLLEIPLQKIPLDQKGPDSKDEQERFKKYMKSHGLDPKKMAELDALEAHYPGGIAGFLEEALLKFAFS
jgi:hypothetical protein